MKKLLKDIVEVVLYVLRAWCIILGVAAAIIVLGIPLWVFLWWVWL